MKQTIGISQKAVTLKLPLQYKMNNYQAPDKTLWTGRQSDVPLYWHQRVECIDLSDQQLKGGMALLGYAVDEGVARNHGRIGAAEGPYVIRKQLAKLSDHLHPKAKIYDVGNIECRDANLEVAHYTLCSHVKMLLDQQSFPIVMGGGHDIAHAHYRGIKSHLKNTGKKIGVINLDAHFDLRRPEGQGNSGTPFYQIAEECKSREEAFYYLCLGIQKAANNKELYKTAAEVGAQFLEMKDFQLANWSFIQAKINDYINKVDHIYLTLDMDGFSSAYAPGVSAPSPLGFKPGLVFKVLSLVIESKKLISMDVAELNPNYDQDDATSRLAARCIEFVARHLI